MKDEQNFGDQIQDPQGIEEKLDKVLERLVVIECVLAAMSDLAVVQRSAQTARALKNIANGRPVGIRVEPIKESEMAALEAFEKLGIPPYAVERSSVDDEGNVTRLITPEEAQDSAGVVAAIAVNDAEFKRAFDAIMTTSDVELRDLRAQAAVALLKKWGVDRAGQVHKLRRAKFLKELEDAVTGLEG